MNRKIHFCYQIYAVLTKTKVCNNVIVSELIILCCLKIVITFVILLVLLDYLFSLQLYYFRCINTDKK